MLSSFFGKKATQPLATQKPDEVTKAPSVISLDLDTESEEIPPPPSSQVTRTSSPPPEPDFQSIRPLKRKESSSYPASQTSHSSSPITAKSTKKQPGDTKSGQMKLSSFFAAPPKHPESSSKSSQQPSEIDLEDPSLVPTQQSSAFSDDPEQLENDDQISSSQNTSSQTTQTSLSNRSGSSSQPRSSQSTAASWSTLMAPLVAPLCTVHMEPTKELTVNKPGPNKGKKFYVCSRLVARFTTRKFCDVDEDPFLRRRPVGPGYDRGKAERLREEVNHRYKCNFFKWASDVRKETTRASTSKFQSQPRSQPKG